VTATVLATTSADVLVELGGLLFALAVIGRLAERLRLPAVPFFVVLGLLVGDGGVHPLDASREFLAVGADIGVVLLLLLIGLEYEPTDLRAGLRSNWTAGVVDLVANAVPGVLAGLLLGWPAIGAFLLGGITYISSSGIIAKLLGDLDRLPNRETPVVLSILVLEDLAMAVFLPVAATWALGGDPADAVAAVGVALVVVVAALVVSARYGVHVSRVIETRSDEMLVFTVLGLTLLVAGLAEQVKVSAAVGAFLLGVTLSGRVAEQGRALLVPVRDLFAGVFFVSFGLGIVPGDLVHTIGAAVALAAVTAASKFGTGWWAAKRAGIGPRGRRRAALSLIPRGEFSIVIAGLGVAAGVEPDLGPLAASYVLILALVGSLAIRFADSPRRVNRAGVGRRATLIPGS
jgi:CPA2 family monovalent cation:H+ antiporter-2